jgi:hypothetical protein
MLKLFWPFGSVFGTTLTPVRNPQSIKSTSYNMIADTGQVFYPAAADKHYRVLLQVMTNAGDI